VTGATPVDDTAVVVEEAAGVVGAPDVVVTPVVVVTPGNNLVDADVTASLRNLTLASNMSFIAFLKHAKLYSTKPISTSLPSHNSLNMTTSPYNVCLDG
jgi:hydroxymethylpyrimidine/phosphomethylpyrimidine kinase